MPAAPASTQPAAVGAARALPAQRLQQEPVAPQAGSEVDSFLLELLGVGSRSAAAEPAARPSSGVPRAHAGADGKTNMLPGMLFS